MASHRALVIGVASTAYRKRQFRRLAGVERDVERVNTMLAERGFELRPAPSDPTVQSVCTALSELVDATEAGEVGVIYLAGHGYRVRDASGDESDGWDEAFVCSDHSLPDDWFRDELWPRARDGARFVVVVDACHSDSMTTRMTEDPPLEIVEAPPKGYYRLTLAACREQETTPEVPRIGGVVTTEMLAALRDFPEITYGDLWVRVASRVRDRNDRMVAPPSYLGPDGSLLGEPAFRVRG